VRGRQSQLTLAHEAAEGGNEMGFLDRLRRRDPGRSHDPAAERADTLDEQAAEERPKSADELEEEVAQARDEDAIQRPRFH
jgi:hypothetical protein